MTIHVVELWKPRTRSVCAWIPNANSTLKANGFGSDLAWVGFGCHLGVHWSVQDYLGTRPYNRLRPQSRPRNVSPCRIPFDFERKWLLWAQEITSMPIAGPGNRLVGLAMDSCSKASNTTTGILHFRRQSTAKGHLNVRQPWSQIVVRWARHLDHRTRFCCVRCGSKAPTDMIDFRSKTERYYYGNRSCPLAIFNQRAPGR